MLKSKGIQLILVSLVILALLAGGSCSLFNKPPEITSLTSSATQVARGGSCTVSCVATDPNADDTLTYAWTATGGSISGTGSTVTWTAPTTEGSYSVTVTVSDGKEAVNESCTIMVVNTPPSITSLTPSTTELAPGDSCTIGCVASDADGDSLSFAWTATGGTITGAGNSASWEAPLAEGTYTISVTVSDGNGGSDSDSVDITVEMKYGAIDIKSDPAGAAVFLDGVDTGNITPYVITNLSPGSYTVELRYYHYKYRAQTVAVTPNETTFLNWSLTFAPELTLTIQPDEVAGKDAYVYDANPNNNDPDSPGLPMGARAMGIYRSYLQFNLDPLPDDAVIVGARLALYNWYSVPGNPAGIGVYNVLAPWAEDVITWNNQPNFATTSEYALNLPAAVTNAFHYWYISDLVKGWWDGSIPNHGVVLKSTNESAQEGWKSFYSSDWSAVAERPQLIIYYFDPTS
jgi:hypothetical protein